MKRRAKVFVAIIVVLLSFLLWCAEKVLDGWDWIMKSVTRLIFGNDDDGDNKDPYRLP